MGADIQYIFLFPRNMRAHKKVNFQAPTYDGLASLCWHRPNSRYFGQTNNSYTSGHSVPSAFVCRQSRFSYVEKILVVARSLEPEAQRPSKAFLVLLLLLLPGMHPSVSFCVISRKMRTSALLTASLGK